MQDSVVDNEASNDNKYDVLKLEYDLLCWHNYYEKCHELEKSYQIEDDNIKTDSNVDITERNLIWDTNEGDYFQTTVIPVAKKNFLKRHPEYKQEEKKYLQSIEERKKTREDIFKMTAEKINNYHNGWMLTGILACILVFFA